MTARPRKLLWVDDEADSLLNPLGQLIKKKTGMSVDVATTYTQAVNFLSHTTYDAVLTDVMLPFEPMRDVLKDLGLSLASTIRTGKFQASGGTNSDVPILMLSVVRYEAIEVQLKTIEGLPIRYFNKTTLLESESLDRFIKALSET